MQTRTLQGSSLKDPCWYGFENGWCFEKCSLIKNHTIHVSLRWSRDLEDISLTITNQLRYCILLKIAAASEILGLQDAKQFTMQRFLQSSLITFFVFKKLNCGNLCVNISGELFNRLSFEDYIAIIEDNFKDSTLILTSLKPHLIQVENKNLSKPQFITQFEGVAFHQLRQNYRKSNLGHEIRTGWNNRT